MSIAGHSRRMLEHYSHIRLEAKRKALDALAQSPEKTVPTGYGTNHGTSSERASAESTKLSMSWWTWPGSNRRPPECHSGALPTALQAHP